jgi:hypothetical protein
MPGEREARGIEGGRNRQRRFPPERTQLPRVRAAKDSFVAQKRFIDVMPRACWMTGSEAGRDEKCYGLIRTNSDVCPVKNTT